MNINIVISVPEDFADRLDMVQLIEGEIKANRWLWNQQVEPAQPARQSFRVLAARHPEGFVAAICSEKKRGEFNATLTLDEGLAI